MKHFRIAIALALGTALFAAGTANAGEITGNGEETPIKAWQEFPDAPGGPASSVCAFSGLNDDPSEDGNRTQSWGIGISSFIEFAGGAEVGAQISADQGPGDFAPGTQCRGLPVNPLPDEG